MKLRGLALLCLLLDVTSALAGDWRQDDWRVIEDSLRQVPPKQREWWLRQRGMGDLLSPRGFGEQASAGLRLVGKWGRGPSVEVTGRDTLVALSLGSEIALLNLADPDRPEVLSEIQLNSMAGEAQIAGSRLYVNSTGSFEVWDIANPASPVRLGQLPYGIGGFEVIDTLLYFTRQDTFRVFSVADPVNCYQLGAYRDSGYFLCATPATAVLGHPDHGLYFADITDPRSPHRAGSFSTDIPRSAEARGNLCCATVESHVEPYPIRFLTIDISNPASPSQLGSLANAGGYDLYLDGPLAFASGRGSGVQNPEPFQILSIADSTRPAVIDTCHTTDRYGYGVWANSDLNRALVADESDGLALVDISNINDPQLDTFVLVAASAEDVYVVGDLCYVADGMAGLKVLDVSDPTRPTQIGEVDTSFWGSWSYAVAARDSVAYISYWNPWFRSVDVSDPTRPRFIGGCSYPPNEEPQDIVLRDSFAYAAMHYDFNVINVSDPRNPRVVGSCGLQNATTCLFVTDTLAYVGNWPSPIVDLRDPAHPAVIGEFPVPSGGIQARDTFAYVARTYDSFYVYSVANPAAPRRLSALDLSGGRPYGQYNLSVALADTVAYIGGWQLKAVSVADPRQPREVGSRWSPPSYYVPRLTYVEPHLYVACSDGGMCILETLQTGVGETEGYLAPVCMRASPSVTRGKVAIDLAGIHLPCELRVCDVLGAEVSRQVLRQSRTAQVDLSARSDGVYLLMVRSATGNVSLKVTKVWGEWGEWGRYPFW